MEIRISEENLKNIIQGISKTIVGKICKRFEILGDKRSRFLKEDIKELIYEGFRDLGTLLLVKGTDKETIVFKPKKEHYKENIVFKSKEPSRKEWNKL